MRRKIIFTIFILTIFAACNSTNDKLKTAAERRADELNKRNSIKKGRYVCYELSASGDKVAPELLMLSDDMYQVNDTPGRYVYDAKRNAIRITDGPLYNPAQLLIGFYTPRGSATTGGGKTLDTMIEFKKLNEGDSAANKIVMQCNCEEK